MKLKNNKDFRHIDPILPKDEKRAMSAAAVFRKRVKDFKKEKRVNLNLIEKDDTVTYSKEQMKDLRIRGRP
jgi:hypothetical protein